VTDLITISQPDLKTLRDFYILIEPVKVQKFLEKHSFLLPLLLEAPGRIHHFFPNSPLSLRVMDDPELVEQEQLIISIPSDLEPQEAVNRQNQLDDEWWRSVPFEAWEHLCLLLE
jgi:hypothetical protein